jgi:hypothetical protein
VCVVVWQGEGLAALDLSQVPAAVGTAEQQIDNSVEDSPS